MMENFVILHEEEVLDELSLEDVKGGLASGASGCCQVNTECNVDVECGVNDCGEDEDSNEHPYSPEIWCPWDTVKQL